MFFDSMIDKRRSNGHENYFNIGFRDFKFEIAAFDMLMQLQSG